MASAGTTNSQRDNRRVRQRARNKKNHRGEGPERAGVGPTTIHQHQRDERQIDTGCFKTSAIDNRNRSGVAVARGFRVNLAPHSLPQPSFTLLLSFSSSSFPSRSSCRHYALVSLSLAFSRECVPVSLTLSHTIASCTHSHTYSVRTRAHTHTHRSALSPPPLAPDRSPSL